MSLADGEHVRCGCCHKSRPVKNCAERPPLGLVCGLCRDLLSGRIAGGRDPIRALGDDDEWQARVYEHAAR